MILKSKAPVNVLKKNNMKEIITKHGEVRQIAKLISVSEETTKNALKGRTKSVLAAKIRALAIERGGAELNRKK